MLSKKTATTWIALAVLSLVPASLALAQAEDPDAYGDDYYAGDFGRVRYQENGGTIVRSNPDPAGPLEDETSLNAPIFPGDEYRTASDQRAEVELAGGSLIRLDQSTRLTFLALPSPSASIADDTVLQLFEGTIRIAAYLSADEEFRIDTPAGSVYLLGEGDFRIEADSRGTEVLSRRGVAELSGNGGSVLIRGGSVARVYPGSVPEEAVAFNTLRGDRFDAWVADRDAAYRVRDHYAGSQEAYEEIPAEVRPYYTELSYNGDWRYVDDYGYVWSPRGVASDWRPYRDGYWSYGPSGYFWVSWERWGWAPYHYGRWGWIGGNWCWIPGRVFAGAWVAWSWGSLHLGWSPLDYWGRPCYVRSLYHGYYDPYAWTFVSYHHVNRRHYARYAVHVNDVHDLGGNAVVTRPPRVSPRDLETSPTARNRARERVAADRGSRLHSINRDERPKGTMRDFEKRVTGRRTGFDGSSTALGRPVRGGTSGRADASSAGTPAGTSARPRATPQLPSRPRMTSGSAVPGGGTRGDRDRARPTTRPGSSDDQRRRDLYDRMSSPRRTRDRSTVTEPRRTPARPSADRQSDNRGSTRSGGTRAVPTRTRDSAPADRGRTARPSSRPRPAPPSANRGRSSGPSTKARPSSGSSRRPSAGSRSNSGSTRRPSSAGRSSSGSSRKPSSARSSSSGSSRKPSASRSSSGSSRKPSSARSSSKSRKSPPKSSSRSRSTRPSKKD